MKMNKRRLGLYAASLLMTAFTLNTLSGCRQSESQAVREIATQAMREQSEQNQRIADTTRDLVAADARAREELIETHARLQETLQEERANLDHQQSELNELREEIELDRRRAPVIAEAIHIVGGILVCLCPLLLAAYILYSVNRISVADEHQIVSEILIGELTSETPRLLAPATRLAITGHCSTESVDPAEREPPF